MDKNKLNIYGLSKSLESNPIESLKKKMFSKIIENNIEPKIDIRKNSDYSITVKPEEKINSKVINQNNNKNEDLSKNNNNKSKPTGISLNKVLINDINIEYWEKLTFKIHYRKKQFVLEFDSPKYEEPKYKSKIEISFEDIKDLIFFTNDFKIKFISKNVRISKESQLKNDGLWEKGKITDILMNKNKQTETNLKYELKLTRDQFYKLYNNKNNIAKRIESLGLKYKIENKTLKDANKKYLKEIKSERIYMEFHKFEQEIKNWQVKQKLEWIKKRFNVPNVKSKSNKQLNCPIYLCNISFQNIPTLKSHINNHHKILLKNGLEIDSNGNFSFKNMNNVFDGNIKVMTLFKDLINKIIQDGEKINK